MLESLSRDSFSFLDLTEEEKQKRGILGRLYGPCADLIHDTRNGRKYSQKLWEKVFNDDLVKEAFANGGIPGELDHPEDRSEICSEKIAVMMPEAPKKDKNGTLVAYFDILDTPCGRIAYQLAKYGYKWGISSRGEGDVIEDYNGDESVDPETYSFKCFDVVLCPSVKAARMNMVESLQPNLKKALTESLKKASNDDRKIMEETLDNLNISYKDSNTKETSAANDDGTLVELRESIKRVSQLSKSNQELQEKLSAYGVREASLKEELQRYKDAVISLSTQAKEGKALKKQIKELTEQLSAGKDLSKKRDAYIESLRERVDKATRERDSLKESLSKVEQEKTALNESFNANKSKAFSDVKKLTEQLESSKADLSLKTKECNRKIQEAKALVEKYQRVANNAINRYIESKALALGLSTRDITSRLNEKYTFDDIDRICESLRSYQVRTSGLPVDLIQSKEVRAKVKESKEPIMLADGVDDEVDESLLRLVNNTTN